MTTQFVGSGGGSAVRCDDDPLSDASSNGSLASGQRKRHSPLQRHKTSCADQAVLDRMDVLMRYTHVIIIDQYINQLFTFAVQGIVPQIKIIIQSFVFEAA